MRRRVWFRLFSALAAAWSFSRGIGTTYRSFATGVAATQLRRRTHRSRWLFEEHPALRRRRRPRRGDLGLGHSGRRYGDGSYDQDTTEHSAVFRRWKPRDRWRSLMSSSEASFRMRRPGLRRSHEEAREKTD